MNGNQSIEKKQEQANKVVREFENSGFMKDLVKLTELIEEGKQEKDRDRQNELKKEAVGILISLNDLKIGATEVDN